MSRQSGIKKIRGDVNKIGSYLLGKANLAPSQIGTGIHRSRSSEHADKRTTPIKQKEMAFLWPLYSCGHERFRRHMAE